MHPHFVALSLATTTSQPNGLNSLSEKSAVSKFSSIYILYTSTVARLVHVHESEDDGRIPSPLGHRFEVHRGQAPRPIEQTRNKPNMIN